FLGSVVTEPSDLPGAEEIDPELLQCFSEETDEHLENIDDCLNHLGVRITDSVALTPSTQEALHSLRRSVHTLKGAAAVIGIEQVAAWGHDFEDFLDWLHDEARRLDPSAVAALRDGADLLASLAEEPTRPAEKEKQRITAKFAEITEAFSSGSAAGENDKGEETVSSLLLDKADNALDPSRESRDSAADFFIEDCGEETEEADSFFDEFASPASSVAPVEEAMDDELLLQDADEEDDFLGSVVAGLSGSPEDQAFFPEEEGVPEELQTADETGRDGGEGADNFFDEVPVDTPDGTEAAVEFLSEISGFGEQAAEEDIDEELLRCFHEEAEEHLDNIDRQLNHLGMTISGATKLSDLKRSSLHSIRRSVHTINKGASAVIGIEQVAAWGHNFEDFLDWLHDEARSIHPEVVEAMQEGADIFVRLVRDPNCSVRADQQGVLGTFTRITTGDIGKLSIDDSDDSDDTDDSDEGTAEDTDVALPSDHVSGEKTTTAPARQSRIRKSATLRVDVNRIDQMVGLSGDMVINLSSFEDSMDATSGTMKELDMILQRLKNINSSLEAGYELASIPHLGSQDDLRASGITEDFDPLEMDRYSELNILIRSLSEAVSDLDSIMAQNALDNVAWQKTVERQGMVLKELQNRMIGVRMTPLSTLSSRMHRTVREAERTTGHPSRLTIDGESIMMDTRVWDVMADPLMHILRNAVAHGGSLPQKAGWESLSVTIQATRKGGLCTLRVSDDGKGLDYEAIRVKGMKLYPNDRINLMSDSELAELIFRHGFSSTGSITNIAGRGVGMDVVRDAIDQLNGSIELISERGRGTEFIMRLPVAVAQLPAILARFGTRIYAIPLHDVASVARVAPEEKTGREYTFEGETVPLLHPAEVPGFETGTGYIEEHLAEDDQALLIVHAGRKRAAVLCEQLIGQRDIVFKDLGTHLHNVPCISGVTIMGNGDLIPILQMEELLRKWTSVIKRPDERFTAGPVKERGPLRILVVDDSISVRKVVSNFITQQGWIPVAARNGIEAIEKIREEKPDFILLDVEMPRMNGFEVLQTMQAQPELRDIPVAMLTSRSADKYQEKARELGARGFMTKPFKADEVIRFIRKETADEEV
ncbi:chemosensory pili system protein ChpA (sensor histidine kinase/response regulator), partial [Candidatus Electrothrix marina]